MGLTIDPTHAFVPQTARLSDKESREWEQRFRQQLGL
jgi:LPS sulfotransferase NodH